MKTLHEVPSLSPSEKDLLNEISTIIHGFLPAATVLLYGSVARGIHETESDFDILVLADETLTTEQEDVIYKAIFKLELATGIVISTMFYAKSEWDMPIVRVSPFHKEVERDSIVL